MDELLTRLLLAALLMGGGAVLFLLFNRFILHRTAELSRRLPGWQPGRAGILYFTTPDCAPCRTVQRPALQRVKLHWGDRLQIIEIDASRQRELAKQWGVLSVPTTFLLDASGQPRFVNHGVTRAEQLMEQLRRLNGHFDEKR